MPASIASAMGASAECAAHAQGAGEWIGVRVGRGVTPPGVGLGDGDGDGDGEGLGHGEIVSQEINRYAWTVPTAPAADPLWMGVRVGRGVTPFSIGVGVGVQVLVVSPVTPTDADACRFCAPTTAIAANSKTSP